MDYFRVKSFALGIVLALAMSCTKSGDKTKKSPPEQNSNNSETPSDCHHTKSLDYRHSITFTQIPAKENRVREALTNAITPCLAELGKKESKFFDRVSIELKTLEKENSVSAIITNSKYPDVSKCIKSNIENKRAAPPVDQSNNDLTLDDWNFKFELQFSQPGRSIIVGIKNEWRKCTKDSDCVLVDDITCGPCKYQDHINKKWLKTYNSEFAKKCSGFVSVVCTEYLIQGDIICRDGNCKER